MRALLFGASLGSFAGAAAPAAGSGALTWSAPGGCVGESELQKRVERTVRREKIGLERKVLGRMVRTADGYRAILRVQERGRVVGRRVLQFEDRDCRAADEALELVVAMLLEGGLREDERTAKTPEAIVQREEPEEPAQSEELPDRATNGELTWTLTAALEGNGGLLPELALGPRLDAGVRLRLPLSFHLFGSFFPSRSSGPGPSTGGSVSLMMLRLGSAACYPVLEGSWLIQGCLGGGALVQWARGIGVPEESTGTWAQAEVHLGARIAGPLWENLRWTAGAELGAPFGRAEYFIETATGQEILFTTAPVVGSGFVGIHATF